MNVSGQDIAENSFLWALSVFIRASISLNAG